MMVQDSGIPFDVKGVIEYQKGAVVSKTLIRKETGTITCFAFDEGQELSEHTSPFEAYVQITEGEAMITLAGRSACLTEGESLVMPANVPHALKAVKPFKMILVMIKS